MRRASERRRRRRRFISFVLYEAQANARDTHLSSLSKSSNPVGSSSLSSRRHASCCCCCPLIFSIHVYTPAISLGRSLCARARVRKEHARILPDRERERERKRHTDLIEKNHGDEIHICVALRSTSKKRTRRRRRRSKGQLLQIHRCERQTSQPTSPPLGYQPVHTHTRQARIGSSPYLLERSLPTYVINQVV